MKDEIRQPENLSSKIWRYLDLQKFTRLLETQKLYLSRADKFQDTHEGATPAIQKSWEADQSPGEMQILSNFRHRQKEWTFISCWCHCEHESHALWQIFSGLKQGVAVRSQYIRLYELAKGHDMEVGLVDYGREDPITQNTLLPYFRKRKHFSYEQEARLVRNIYRCSDVFDNEGRRKAAWPCLEIPIDMKTFIEVIRVHPEADKAYFNVIKSVVSKYAPELLNRVEISEMAGPPMF